MAGDWLKVEITTPDKPEIFDMAARLMIEDNDTVFAKVVRVWIWFDQHTEDGHAKSVTKSFLDRVTGIKGFCDAMIDVGWMLEIGDEVILPNFDRHNGETAKRRAENNRRKARSREKSREKRDSCHEDSHADGHGKTVTKASTREEKSTYIHNICERSEINQALVDAGIRPQRLARHSKDRAAIDEWIKLGVTQVDLNDAISHAIDSQPDTFCVAYLDPIVKQVVHARKHPSPQRGKKHENHPGRSRSGADILAEGCEGAFAGYGDTEPGFG